MEIYEIFLEESKAFFINVYPEFSKLAEKERVSLVNIIICINIVLLLCALSVMRLHSILRKRFHSGFNLQRLHCEDENGGRCEASVAIMGRN